MPVAKRTRLGVLWFARVDLSARNIYVRRSDEEEWRLIHTFAEVESMDFDLEEEPDGTLVLVLILADTLSEIKSSDGGQTWA